MVGYSKKYENFTNLDYILAGGGSGCITRALCQPLDVLKIRFQLQVEPISHVPISKYQSLFQGFRLILKEEGIRALWKGHVPAQWLSITYGMAQFATFEYLDKEAYLLEVNPKHKYFVNFACGMVSGFSATLVSFPFDVIRTRLIAQSEQKKVYRGLVHSWQSIMRNESSVILFRGFLPTLLQVAPHAGVQFTCYKYFTDLFNDFFENKNTSLSSSLVCGSLAGFCAKIAIYPFDIVKKRMQIQGFEEGRQMFGKFFQCEGMVDAVAKIYKGEGAPGFFKGLTPGVFKALVTSGLYFSTYEMSCEIISYFK